MHRPPRLYLIAGEASGDLHGSNLMRAIRSSSPDVEFRFWGGDRMSEHSDQCVKHIKELAFMGFWEVFKNLRTILGNIQLCKEDILSFKPDALVLIDYPGFNLRIAEWAKLNGIPVYYYISPQVWAWKESRVKKIKSCVNHMFVILPFEQAFYKGHGMDVDYVGHPLLDAIDAFQEANSAEILNFRRMYELDDRPILAVLPGSRRQEISVKLPIMLEATRELEHYQIVVAGAPNIERSYYEKFMGSSIRIVQNQTYLLLSNAKLAIVTSGTATLETALFGVPEVVCYKGSKLSYLIAKQLVKIKYISLVNLIMDKEVVRELIQDDCNSVLIREELNRIIHEDDYRNKITDSFLELRSKLGEGGASEKVAQSLLKSISQV